MNETAIATDRRKRATNITLDKVLKAAAIQFCKDNNVDLSELTGNFLERRLIEAGYIEKTDLGFRSVKSTPEVPTK